MPWRLRGLLAAVLLFFSDFVFWTDPIGRAPLEWALRAGGYGLLAALLLDLAARYRVRDVFGLLALAGIGGLLISLLISAETALADVPRTWATRVLGAHTLAVFVSLALVLALTAGRVRGLWLWAGGVGLVWGLWARWLPDLTGAAAQSVSLPVFLLIGLSGLLILALLTRWTAGRPANLTALRLSPLTWVGLLFAGGALLLYRRDHIDSISLIVLPALTAYCWLVLWFQQRDQGSTLLDASLPPQPAAWGPLLVWGGLFLAGSAVGFSLPLTAALDPLAPLVALLAAFGLVWLPTISLVLGVRAYRNLGRQKRL
jgi:hypothetical protein